jgi:hypothetical protein
MLGRGLDIDVVDAHTSAPITFKRSARTAQRA